jgi:hypothetical protein
MNSFHLCPALLVARDELVTFVPRELCEKKHDFGQLHFTEIGILELPGWCAVRNQLHYHENLKTGTVQQTFVPGWSNPRRSIPGDGSGRNEPG